MNKIYKAITRLILVTMLVAFIAPVKMIWSGAGNQIATYKGVIVKYKDEAKSETVKANVKKKLKLKDIKSKRKLKRGKVEVVEVDEGYDIAKVVSELKKDANVLYAQPDYKLFVNYIPEEPDFSSQWGLKNKNSQDIDIGITDAWDITKGRSDVIVGILDTGLDISHEELAKNIYTNTKEIAGNGKDDDKNGYIDDVNGWNFVNKNGNVYDSAIFDMHGTHVAGIIGAEENKKGIIGVSPNVKLLPLKFINGDSGYTSDAIQAIEYAKSAGASIINCSWGGPDENEALKDEIKNSSDVLFIAAAGNSGKLGCAYPAGFNLPNIVSVGAVDRDGKLATFSNYGPKVQLAAPGVNILSTIPGNNYGTLNGTSMSTPFVTGISVLLKSQNKQLKPAEIIAMLKNGAIEQSSLKGKVATGGIVNAKATLNSNTDGMVEEQQQDEQSNDKSDSSKVEALATAQPLLAEQIHYGKEGVYPPTGNFSDTYTDLSGIYTPWGEIKITRTINSLGTWSFGFLGTLSVQDSGNSIVVNIGKETYAFRKYDDGKYYPYCNHSSLEIQSDSSYVMTTKEQMRYYFTVSGILSCIKDRYDNTLSFSITSIPTGGYKTNSINYKSGIGISITYNDQNLIQSITDSLGRTVQYEYTGGRLSCVTNPMGNKTYYSYDSSTGRLTSVKNNDNETVYSFEYDYYGKVYKLTDAVKNTYTFTYDTTNKKTTVIDSNQNKYIYSYDDNRFITSIQDPEDKISSTQYNDYGEETSITDRYGNITKYDRGAFGSVTKITNPDGSIKTYEYDSKNNITKECDETGNTTYYIYSPDKIYLVKKVQPLNGKDTYSDTADQSKFAITTYTYNSYGQVVSEKDPEDNVKAYEYDTNGYLVSETTPEGNMTKYTNNILGWTTKIISPKGYITDYTFDNNGALIKASSSTGETKRYIYNAAGRLLREITPNLYDPTAENTTANTYDGGEGSYITYYPSGLVRSITDAENNTKSYTYDLYGQVETETKGDGSMTKYEYDKLNRLYKVYFVSKFRATPVLLKEYKYESLTDARTKKTEKVYLNDKDTVENVEILDFRNNVVEKINPEGDTSSIQYYSNGAVYSTKDENGYSTYYRYDGMGRLTEQWVPFEDVNGQVYYSYSAIEYDKAGRITAKNSSPEKTKMFVVPGKVAGTHFTYDKDGRKRSEYTDSGKRTEYEYDADGGVIKITSYLSKTDKVVRSFENNQFGKNSKMKEYIEKRDIAGNDITNKEQQELVTVYEYDKEGNVISVTKPDGARTEFEYDRVGRQTSTSIYEVDEAGNQNIETVSTGYDFDGKKISSIDGNGYVTKYQYNRQGLLEKVVDPAGGITAYFYDRSGRKTAEVSPANYIINKPLSEMNRIEYTYDKAGRLKTKCDVYKNSTTGKMDRLVSKAYKYDQKGNVVKELDALGYLAGTGSTADEHISTGYGTEYSYNAGGLKVSTLDPVSKEKGLDFTSKTEHDAMGQKVSDIDADGDKESYEYDLDGNLLFKKHTNHVNKVVSIIESNTFDFQGNVLTKKDAKGYIATYEYNNFGKLRKTKLPGDDSVSSMEITNQYDNQGRLIKEIYPNGKVKIHNYNSKDLETSTIDQKADESQSITVSSVYDSNGNKIVQKDGNGNEKVSKYDALNRLISEKTIVTDVKGKKITKIMSYTYDKNGNQTSIKDWRGNTTIMTYDPLNRLVKKTDQNGKVIESISYNANSSQSKSTDAVGNTTFFYYDKNNRLVKKIDPLKNVTLQSYNNDGNIESKTDGIGNVTRFVYDDFNRLIQVKNAKDELSSYGYDANGNMTSIKNDKGYIETYEYNAVNKVKRRIDHGGKIGLTYNKLKTVSYTYDCFGNMASAIDRNGIKTSFYYDIHGRLVKKEAGKVFEENTLNQSGEKLILSNVEVAFVEYSYDDNGNIITIEDSTGITSRTYDEENRVTTKTVPQFGTSKFQYDVTGKNIPKGNYVEITTDPKGNMTNKMYDKVGRLCAVTTGTQTTTISYYDNGNRKSVTYPDGSTEVYSYNGNNQIVLLSNYRMSGGVKTLMDTYRYTYDNAGNQATKNEIVNGVNKGITSYSYDKLNRLESVAEPSGRTTAYTYDSVGNRATETVNITGMKTVNTYTYDTENRLLSVRTKVNDVETAVVKYVYDRNGNMISRSNITLDSSSTDGGVITAAISGENDNSTTYYEYDNFNQLVKVEAGSKTQYYNYNGEGYRVEKTVAGKTTRYLYEADKVVLEVDDDGLRTARNIYGTNLLARTIGTTTVYYMYNGHGDVTALLDASSSQIKAAYSYDEWGKLKDNNKIDGEFEKDDNKDGKDDNWTVTTATGLLVTSPTISGGKAQKIKTTATAGSIHRVYATIAGHKYLFAGSYYIASKGGSISTRVNSEGNSWNLNLGSVYWSSTLNQWKEAGVLFTATNTNTSLIPCYVDTQTCEVYIDKWKLIDLTEIYGAGNEPATAAAAMTDFDNSIMYAGYQYDKETGLYYLNARMYDPQIARFLQEDTYTGDPSDPLSLNLYTYCHNEPLMYWDPSGHETTETYYGHEYTSEELAKNRAKWEKAGHIIESLINGDGKYDHQDLYDLGYAYATLGPKLFNVNATVIMKGKFVKILENEFDKINSAIKSAKSNKSKAYLMSRIDSKAIEYDKNAGFLESIGITVSGFDVVKDAAYYEALGRELESPTANIYDDKIFKVYDTINSIENIVSSIGIGALSSNNLRSRLNSIKNFYNKKNNSIDNESNVNGNGNSGNNKLNGDGGSSKKNYKVKENVKGKKYTIKGTDKTGDACFTGETSILTKDGLRSIKDIKSGDEVYSENPETGEKEIKKVVKTFVHDVDTIRNIYISEKKIETTPVHPFWVVGEGWVRAENLKEGDRLLLYSGDIVKISKTEDLHLDKSIKVYNFEVADFHTYFVSDMSILVHNKPMRYSGPWFEGEELPADAPVVRGGMSAPDSLKANQQKDQVGNTMSANGGYNVSEAELSKGLPQNKISTCTVGDLNAKGYKVIASPTNDNPYHVSIVTPGGKVLTDTEAANLSSTFTIKSNPTK